MKNIQIPKRTKQQLERWYAKAQQDFVEAYTRDTEELVFSSIPTGQPEPTKEEVLEVAIKLDGFLAVIENKEFTDRLKNTINKFVQAGVSPEKDAVIVVEYAGGKHEIIVTRREFELVEGGLRITYYVDIK